MALVHSLGRMHRDLKSGNILATLTLNGVVRLKVADFGTAALAGQKDDAGVGGVGAQRQQQKQQQQQQQVHNMATVMHTKGVGTLLWMSPELLAGKKYGQSADVYSYAIVLWEIASHSYPWEELAGTWLAETILERVEAGVRPVVEDDWNAHYVNVMARCWALNPAERPTFNEIKGLLE